MHLLTWNIHKGKGAYRGPVPFSALLEAVAPLAPDLIGMQEVFHPRARPEIGQSQLFAEHFGYAMGYVPNATYTKGDHGNASLVRWPDFSVHNHDLSTNPIEKRGLLHGQLPLERGDRLHFLNTHLGLNAPQRRRQVRRIAEVIKEDCPVHEPLILVGDFNDWTGRLDRRVQRLCGLESALTEIPRSARRTWPAPRPVFGLDRIYIRGLRCVEAEVLAGEPWVGLSDHLPIRARLELLPQPSPAPANPAP